MYDNIYTKYKNAKIFINEINANTAYEELMKDLKAKDMNAEKYAYLSKACIFLQKDDLALKYAKMSVKSDRTYAYGYIRLAFAYARIGKKKDTLKNTIIAEKFCKSEPFINSFLIILYEYCGYGEKANKLFNELEKNYDYSSEYSYHLGFLYSQKDPEKCISYLTRALENSSLNKYGICSIIAENYKLLEDYDNAERYADICLAEGLCSRILEIKTECLKAKGLYEEASKYIHKQYKLARSNDEKLEALVMLIYTYLNSPTPEKCSHYLDFAFKHFEPTYALYYVTATYFETIEEYDCAIDAYEKMLEIDPDESSIYTSISYCYSQEDNNEKAFEYVEKAIKHNEFSSYNHYRKGRILTDMKEYGMAITSFLKSLDYDKSDVDSFQWISYCYSMLKDYEKSIEYANRAILLNKEDCYSYFRKAWAFQEMGKFEEAIKFYKQCIEYNDRYIDAYVNISYIYSKLGDVKQSMLYANKAILIDKDYAYAHYRKAWALQESGKFEEAIDGYSKAIELDPTDVYNYLGIACVSLNTQANVNALLYANKAIFLDRKCGGAYYYKSLALSNLGKSKEAEEAYKQALKLGYSPS